MLREPIETTALAMVVRFYSRIRLDLKVPV